VVIFVICVVLLAGNHALPMMLRFVIWIGTKIWRKGEINETLNFLLDHPRR
jgi:Trk-type K+ transport system membrane component